MIGENTNIGRPRQPFEHIELIEPFEPLDLTIIIRFDDWRKHQPRQTLNSQPFEPIELIEPFDPLPPPSQS